MPVAGILISILIITAFVPPVQAGFIELIKNIAGINFNLTADYPGKDSPVTIVPSDTLPLEDVIEDHPFDYPSWAPEGYTLEENVTVSWFPDQDRPVITVTWIGTDKWHITLSIHEGINELVGLTEIETIRFDEKEYALWQGGWNYDEQVWDEDIPIRTLSWVFDGLRYDLQAPEYIQVEQLIQMAESSFPR